MPGIIIHPEVREALDTGRPVVALESAVITHGLPSRPWNRPLRVAWNAWRDDAPVNLEAARMMHVAVREAGAVPAQVALIDGSLCIGVTEAELVRLATARDTKKVASTTLGAHMSSGVTGGTTVSATLVACSAVSPPIRFFATGGIGGVHRGWQQQPDFSADLAALARHAVGVICSGVKSVLDVEMTAATLDALGVPILGWGCDVLPRFVTRSSSMPRLPIRVSDAASASAACRAHWSLGQSSAVIIANPLEASFQLDRAETDAATAEAEALAARESVTGSPITPFLLNSLAQATDGRSLEANLMLLSANARLAAELAGAFARSEQPLNTAPSHPASGADRAR